MAGPIGILVAQTAIDYAWKGSAIILVALYAGMAKNAACAEIGSTKRSIVYLALNDTVGGAFSHHGHNYSGDGFKSAEFGHMIIVPGGKKCYCGKQGCADADCSYQHTGICKKESSAVGAAKRAVNRFIDILE